MDRMENIIEKLEKQLQLLSELAEKDFAWECKVEIAEEIRKISDTLANVIAQNQAIRNSSFAADC